MRSQSKLDPHQPRATEAPAPAPVAATAPAPAPVPLMDTQRTYAAWGSEGETRLRDILRSQRYVAGPYVDALEHDMAKRLGVAHAIAVDSGTDALWLVLRAWFEDLPAHQREVIVPSFTFVATAGAVVAAGGVPIFADVDRDTYLIDPASVRARVTENTAAIVPVHLFGLPVDLGPLRAAAPQARLLEDAAQAIDATQNGVMAGNLADAATFSFYPSKNLGAAGDGGLVTTNDDALAHTIKALRSHGQAQRGAPSTMVGTNSRMDEMQAAVLGAKLPHLSGWTAQRRAVAARYDAALAGCALHTPPTTTGSDPAWHLYTIRLASRAQRDGLQAALSAQGISSGVYYPTPLHNEPCFAPFAPAACPVADELAGTVLSLPCFPGLRPEEQDRVIAVVSRAVASRTIG